MLKCYEFRHKIRIYLKINFKCRVWPDPYSAKWAIPNGSGKTLILIYFQNQKLSFFTWSNYKINTLRIIKIYGVTTKLKKKEVQEN